MIAFRHDDGGRAAAGFKGETRDCVTRAIAIATGLPYLEVYQAINERAEQERPDARGRRSSARTGVRRVTYEPFLRSLGWRWVATMAIGSGCRVHLRADELPAGRIIVRVSRHFAAVIDGVLHDTEDSSRGGTRCVYGYFTKDNAPPGRTP